MKKVLLIEDNVDILYANRVMLELEGYEILTAETGDEGRRLALEKRPELIILDIMLKDVNGIELCRELCREHEFKVIFLSALGTDKSVTEAIRAGGFDYITKPYLMDNLIGKVRAALTEEQKLS